LNSNVLPAILLLTVSLPAVAQAQGNPESQAAAYAASNAEFDLRIARHKSSGSSPPTLPKIERVMVVDVRSNEGLSLLNPKIDPGFAVAICPQSLDGAPAGSILDFTTLDPRVLSTLESLTKKYLICANSEFGAAVIGLRKWYCDTDIECLKSEWEGDRPKWGSKLDESFYSYTINGITITRYTPGTSPAPVTSGISDETKRDACKAMALRAPVLSSFIATLDNETCRKANDRAVAKKARADAEPGGAKEPQ
jgi:hypothetical protein